MIVPGVRRLGSRRATSTFVPTPTRAELLLRQREVDVDAAERVERGHGRSRCEVLAEVDGANAGAAGERRPDALVIDLRLQRADLALGGGEGRLVGVEHLPRASAPVSTSVRERFGRHARELEPRLRRRELRLLHRASRARRAPGPPARSLPNRSGSGARRRAPRSTRATLSIPLTVPTALSVTSQERASATAVPTASGGGPAFCIDSPTADQRRDLPELQAGEPADEHEQADAR